jgi:hypothetical protein
MLTKKLKLEELDVASFSTLPHERAPKGTVLANSGSCPGTRWDCSIDFCSDPACCELTTVGQTTHQTQ